MATHQTAFNMVKSLAQRCDLWEYRFECLAHNFLGSRYLVQHVRGGCFHE